MPPGITLAIVAHNEAKNILASISSALPPKHIQKSFELIVIDNASTDETPLILRKLKQELEGIDFKIFCTKKNNLGAARGLAIKEAKYTAVAFLDADCRAPIGWVEKIFSAFLAQKENDANIFAVGGGNIPPKSSVFYQAISLMLSGWLGHLNTSQGKKPLHKRIVAHLPTCNIVYDKNLVLQVGNFSSEFKFVCEDLELNTRASHTGLKIVSIPGIDVTHFFKDSWWSWCKKMFRYGWGQIHVAQKFPRHLMGVKSLPILGIIFLAAILVISIRALMFFILFYLSLLFAISFFISIKNKAAKTTPYLFLAFLLTHLFYSLGELWGVIKLKKAIMGK